MARLRPKPNSTPDDVAFGINPVAIAIERGLARALLYWRDSGNRRVTALVEQAQAEGISVEPVQSERLDELTGGGVHQGVLARIRRVPLVDLDVVANQTEGPALAVLLDQVTDPQNAGAVIRTSAAVGASVIVLPERRGAHLTPGVHRASAGLSMVAPVAMPVNLARAVERLKEHGFWVVAADHGPGAVDATAFDWPPRTALILGSEGRGVGQNLLQHSDFRVVLPMAPEVESLNVGVAFGALAYLWRRQWPLGQTDGKSEGGE